MRPTTSSSWCGVKRAQGGERDEGQLGHLFRGKALKMSQIRDVIKNTGQILKVLSSEYCEQDVYLLDTPTAVDVNASESVHHGKDAVVSEWYTQ
jgi:hypothetical protein